MRGTSVKDKFSFGGGVAIWYTSPLAGSRPLCGRVRASVAKCLCPINLLAVTQLKTPAGCWLGLRTTHLSGSKMGFVATLLISRQATFGTVAPPRWRVGMTPVPLLISPRSCRGFFIAPQLVSRCSAGSGLPQYRTRTVHAHHSSLEERMNDQVEDGGTPTKPRPVASVKLRRVKDGHS